MDETVLVGNGRDINSIPAALWRDQLSARAQEMEAGLRSLSDEHREVRNLVVNELPRVAQPMSPEFISRTLDLSLSRVNAILDELETGLTYLFRDGDGAVTWAYPVTVDVTAHHATFNTGEQIYAA